MFKRKKVKENDPEILTWEHGRYWLKENGWLVHMYDNEYSKGETHFWADRTINGMKVEIKVTATSDLTGIRGLIEMAQKYEIRKRK